MLNLDKKNQVKNVNENNSSTDMNEFDESDSSSNNLF